MTFLQRILHKFQGQSMTVFVEWLCVVGILTVLCEDARNIEQWSIGRVECIILIKCIENCLKGGIY